MAYWRRCAQLSSVIAKFDLDLQLLLFILLLKSIWMQYLQLLCFGYDLFGLLLCLWFALTVGKTSNR